MHLFSKRIVSNLLLLAALTCSLATAVMMSAAAYSLMPIPFYGWILGAAAIALDVAHYLSWAWANWLFQSRSWFHGLIFLCCGAVIAVFSIAATSNKMIHVVLDEMSVQRAEVEVRKPQLEGAIATLRAELAGVQFSERVVSNEKAIRDDIAVTRREAAQYRKEARFRNAEATEQVADSKEASLKVQLDAVDAWNQTERSRVDAKHREINASIEQRQRELLEVASVVNTAQVMSEDMLKLLLRGFAVVLVLVPGIIYSSHATSIFGSPSAPSRPRQEEQGPVTQVPVESLPQVIPEPLEVDREELVPVLAAPVQTDSFIHHEEVEAIGEAPVPADLRDLYTNLEHEVQQLGSGTPVPVGKMAKALKTSTKRLVRLYDLAGQHGLLVRNDKDHWIVA